MTDCVNCGRDMREFFLRDDVRVSCSECRQYACADCRLDCVSCAVTAPCLRCAVANPIHFCGKRCARCVHQSTAKRLVHADVSDHVAAFLA